MDVKEDKKPRGKFFYGFWILAGLFLLWFNYDYLHGHLSSNSMLINNYVPKYDEFEHYKLPAVSGWLYMTDGQKQGGEASYSFGSGYKRANHVPKILIVPQKQYKFASVVTAKAYWDLLKYREKIKNVIILVPGCAKEIKGAILPETLQVETPLGAVEYNQEILYHLQNVGGFKPNQNLFAEETFWYKQVMFLQKILSGFRIAPMVYGDVEPQKLTEVLNPYLNDESTIFIFPADLATYYNESGFLSEKKVTLVENGEDNKKLNPCGEAGIKAALEMAKDRRMSSLLFDGNSAEGVIENIKRSLGYEAWMSEEKSNEDDFVPTPIEQEAKNLKLFAEHHGQELMKIAYLSLNGWVINHYEYIPERKDSGERIFDKGAIFVTLYKNGVPRGQSGSLVPKQASALDVADNVRKAAEDPAFPKIEAEELKDLSISIAFLTDYERIIFENEEDLLNKIVQGTDGIVLRDGNRQGLMLPSAWSEVGDKTAFLLQLKLKAGMSPIYWSDKLKVYRFRTVEIKKNEN